MDLYLTTKQFQTKQASMPRQNMMLPAKGTLHRTNLILKVIPEVVTDMEAACKLVQIKDDIYI